MKFISQKSSLHIHIPAAGFIPVLLLTAFGGYFLTARAQARQAPAASSGVTISQGPVVHAIQFNGSVNKLPNVPPDNRLGDEPEDPVFPKTPPGPNWEFNPDAPVPQAMPTPALNFESVKLNDNCGGANCGAGYPPDTNGDVGPSHYVTVVNTAIAIFDKLGTRLALFRFNQLWNGAGSGTACDANHQGDPTVVYDPIGDRWIVADFAFTSLTVPPFYECIAVSKTNDPVAGGWYLYAVRTDDVAHPYFADYPKMGIWTDALYMTANMFDNTLTFAEVRVWGFNRLQLESGTATSQIVDTNSTIRFSLLPANLRGTRPPVGRDEFLTAESETLWAFEVFKYHIDWVTPANSTFTGPVNVTQDSYIVPAGDVIPQPNTATLLDSLGGRMMMQLQYTNIGGVESLWVAHTIRTSTSGPTGIQWAQINVTGGNANTTAVQQQQFTNGLDGLYRWMPSIATDRQGDAAVGYSVSNTSNYPAIRYAGRLATDTLNTLGQGEASLPVSGLGNENFNCGGAACQRWGDYTAMVIDPVDNCTFWYVDEYYPTPNGSTVWHTRVGNFSYPSCTPYIQFNHNGPDHFNNPGYLFNVTLATADATQQVCLRWSTNAGASWLAQATCTFSAGQWACTMPSNIDSATVTYQFWIGPAGSNCAVTGNETLWTAYYSFATSPTSVHLESFSASHPTNAWVYAIPALGVVCLGGLLLVLLRRRRA